MLKGTWADLMTLFDNDRAVVTDRVRKAITEQFWHTDPEDKGNPAKIVYYVDPPAKGPPSLREAPPLEAPGPAPGCCDAPPPGIDGQDGFSVSTRPQSIMNWPISIYIYIYIYVY